MKQNEKLRNDYQNDIVNFKSNSEEDIAQRDEKIQELEMLMKA